MMLPKMVRVVQEFDRRCLANPADAVRTELERIGLGGRIKPGDRIAITAGSRGIRNNVLMLRTIAGFVRACGGEPFLVGAMGSHGGGTAEGQREVLLSLGVTEAAVGCQVATSAETGAVGRTAEGLGVYCDVNAAGADGIIAFNRVKPHTSFRGPNESGVLKMLAVGLGKAPGANQIHGLGPGAMSGAIRSIARAMMAQLPVLCGVAVVENSFDETARVVAFLPGELEAGEAHLLEEARALLPRLPVAELDLLIVREMGKNFSGTGMDTNVIGRMRIFGAPEPTAPRIARITVLDLTEPSHGNATGIGLADVTTARLEAKLDRHATYLNCTTSTYVQRAFLPIVAPTDHDAILMALRSLGLPEGIRPRVALIHNTLQVDTLWVSEAVADELRGQPALSVADLVESLVFDPAGNLIIDGPDCKIG
jgi:hypothetical protein